MKYKAKLESSPAPIPVPATAERTESVDSSTFFEKESGYDEYGDFGLDCKSAGGGGGGGGTSQKMSRRHQQRGDAGNGTIYSTKHVRAKETLQNKFKLSK